MQTQEILLAVFTGILAFAVLMQTLIFFRMYKTFRRLAERIDGISQGLLKNADKVTVKAEETLDIIQDIGNGLSRWTTFSRRPPIRPGRKLKE